MSIKAFVISFLLIVLALLGGGFAGLSFQKNKDALQLKNEAELSLAVNALSSKVVPSVVAYGQVTKVVGNNITITSQGQSVTILMNADARMYSLVPVVVAPVSKSVSRQSAVSSTNQQITLGDVKVGSNVSISIKVLATGQVQGYSLFVFPAVVNNVSNKK